MAKWPLAKWLSDLWLKWLNDLWLKWLSDLWLWLPILLSSWNAVKMHLNLWRCWRLLCCWCSYWQQPLWMMLDTYVYVLQSLVIGNDTNVSGQHLWNIELWWIWGWMVELVQLTSSDSWILKLVIKNLLCAIVTQMAYLVGCGKWRPTR